MAYNHFDYVPSTVERKRSVFKFSKVCARGALLGSLYPVCAPVRMMPGSTLSLDLAVEIRSQPLIAPLMDEMYCDFFSFFVPNRIVWEHWKQFVGAIDDVLFNNLTQYNIPSFKFGLVSGSTFTSGSENFQWNQLIACHFGIPYPLTANGGGTVPTVYANAPTINALPFRGYTFIWNEYFRPEQIAQPQVISRTDTGHYGMNIDHQFTTANIGGISVNLPIAQSQSSSGGYCVSGGAILPVFRAHRTLWTSCLPAPSLETLNLLGNLQAPVMAEFEVGSINQYASLTLSNQDALNASGDLTTFKALTGSSYSNELYADLSQALLTVNNYRETIMLQNYYDVLNRAGSRYDELIFNIFGTRAGNAVIDIPELITHKRFTIYRNQVIATANSADASSNVAPIGTQAAYIDTVLKDSFFTRSTTEHGYIHMLYAIRPAMIRSNLGVEPEWQELGKMDLYYPQFDGMGDVARSKCEIWWNWNATEASQKADSNIFGFQEYGAVWKYQRNDAVGWFDYATPLPIRGFTLQELVANPALTEKYLSCINECNAFAQCLAIPSPLLAPQFTLDIRLTGSITHPMPVYNIPGAGALL